MRIHPRTRAAGIAAAQLKLDIWRLIDTADLTSVEIMQALDDVAAGMLKSELRAERHNHLDEYGDQVKADEACDVDGCLGNWATPAGQPTDDLS